MRSHFDIHAHICVDFGSLIVSLGPLWTVVLNIVEFTRETNSKPLAHKLTEKKINRKRILRKNRIVHGRGKYQEKKR